MAEWFACYLKMNVEKISENLWKNGLFPVFNIGAIFLEI